MAKTSTFTFRVNAETKKEAQELFDSLDLSMSDAINLFLRQAIIQGGLPFDIKQNKAHYVDVSRENTQSVEHMA